MNDVYIGNGKLAGKGVYAARDFKEGELVKHWDLQPITQGEFDALPKSDHMFVHTFNGKLFLFLEPSRYTNHSANPTVRSDFDKRCDYAIRDIRKGEPITINANLEVRHELDTFLAAYEAAANSRDFVKVTPMIYDKAVFVFTEGTFTGIEAIKQAFEDTWAKIRDEKYTISDVVWVKSGYRNAMCEYKFTSNGIINGERQVYKGKGVNTLRRIRGNWRIVKEELSRLD